MGAGRIDLRAARALVGQPQFLAAAEAAGRLVDRAEAPALDAQPAQILDRIAKMGAFPIEDGGDARFVGEIIASAVVAMHQHRRGRSCRLAPVEPRERQLEHGLRLAERIEEAAQAFDVIGRRAVETEVDLLQLLKGAA